MGIARGTARAAFARFVRRAVDEAKTHRQWSVTRLAEETGIGRSTLFRWLAGEWRDYPELEKVRGFCAALDIPVSAALVALGLPDGGAPASIVDTTDTVRDDVAAILARLEDHAVPTAEKLAIRQALHQLAARPARDAG
jgi:transcriptional regulator with XRE-family HTH domain